MINNMTDQELLAQGRQYGRDIPHLVDPKDYDKMYDPDAIESMQMMYDLTDEDIAKTDNDDYGKAFLRLQTKGFQDRKASQSLTAQDHKDLKVYLYDKPHIISAPKPARKAISLRMFADDVEKLKAKASQLGMPYQTYIISELHKLANS